MTEHPKTAALIVEVSDTTLDYDRNVKANLYAASGIADYWIINIRDMQIEVHRQPELTVTGVYRYLDIHHSQRGEMISLHAKPESQIAVTDLLP